MNILLLETSKHGTVDRMCLESLRRAVHIGNARDNIPLTVSIVVTVRWEAGRDGGKGICEAVSVMLLMIGPGTNVLAFSPKS